MYVGALVISYLLSGSLYRMATLKTISLLRSDLAPAGGHTEHNNRRLTELHSILFADIINGL